MTMSLYQEKGKSQTRSHKKSTAHYRCCNFPVHQSQKQEDVKRFNQMGEGKICGLINGKPSLIAVWGQFC